MSWLSERYTKGLEKIDFSREPGMLNSVSLMNMRRNRFDRVDDILTDRAQSDKDMGVGVISIKDQKAIDAMRQAGRLLAELFCDLQSVVVPGVSTGAIDAFVVAYLQKTGMISQTIGYHGYRHASCISLNDEVVHGVPSMRRIVRDGDLVTVDVCASWQGYCADMARCFFVGEVRPSVRRLAHIASAALDAGITHACPGHRLGDISAAIQTVVEAEGYGVVRDFAGHGIGARMHEDPEVLNYGTAGTGPVLRAGMTFAIEPMITEGSYQVYVDRDGWTVKTVDRRYAAHVEDTVLVTERGPEILTRLS